MTERPPVWQLLDGIQMDLGAASRKLVELRSMVANGTVALKQTLPPDEHIRRLIRNGVIADATDLEAELRGWPALTEGEAQTLRLEAIHLWERQAA